VSVRIGGVISGMLVGRCSSREYVEFPRGYVRRGSGRAVESVSHISKVVKQIKS